jgi:hypothetical protein
MDDWRQRTAGHFPDAGVGGCHGGLGQFCGRATQLPGQVLPEAAGLLRTERSLADIEKAIAALVQFLAVVPAGPQQTQHSTGPNVCRGHLALLCVADSTEPAQKLDSYSYK